MRTKGNLLRRTISASNVCQSKRASKEDCKDGEVVKRALAISAGTVATAIAGLLVYTYYLLRKSAKNAKDYSDQIYTR